VPLYLKRSGSRKVLVEDHGSMNALVVEQAAIAEGNVAAQLVGECLSRLESDDEHQLLADHGTLRPDVIRRENTKILDRKRIEDRLDVFGIDVLSFFGDDHVFLAPEKLKVAVPIEAAKIAGLQPAPDDRFSGQVRLVEITGHDRLTAYRNLADAFPIRIDDTNLHSRKRLAHGVGAKRMQIVYGDGRARLGEAIPVGN